MDWFKYLKRAKVANYGQTMHGNNASWTYKFKFPLEFSGYTPDICIQMFEDGFRSGNNSFEAKPYELRFMILIVPREIGFTLPMNIYIDKKVYKKMCATPKANWWTILPKEKVNDFMNENSKQIYRCFMDAIFNYL